MLRPSHAQDHTALGALLQALKYLPAVAVGLVAVYELIHGHFVLPALAAVMVLAFTSRLDRVTGSQPHSSGPATLDGGSLSARASRAEHDARGKPAVVDGGSLERARHG